MVEWFEPFEGLDGVFLVRIGQSDKLKRANRVLSVQWDRGEQRSVLFQFCDHTQIICLETPDFFSVDFGRNFFYFFLLSFKCFRDFLFHDVGFFEVAYQSLDSLVEDVLVQFSFDRIYIFKDHVAPLKESKCSRHSAVGNVLLEQLLSRFLRDQLQKLDYLTVLPFFVLLVVLVLQFLALFLPFDQQNVEFGSISI